MADTISAILGEGSLLSLISCGGADDATTTGPDETEFDLDDNGIEVGGVGVEVGELPGICPQCVIKYAFMILSKRWV